MIQVNPVATTEIISAVRRGLTAEPKSLPGWLLYDEQGHKIFQQIMNIPEYYPARCEYEIIQHHKEDLIRYFQSPQGPFELIELGAGDGFKTAVLLRHLYVNNVDFIYRPVDISGAVLTQLTQKLSVELPRLTVEPMRTSYIDAMHDLKGDAKKVILFLGASIGNFGSTEVRSFLKSLATHLQPPDQMLIGFDLKKSPETIQQAYNDKAGITREFNLNILKRLNNELGATFNLNKFDHFGSYDPETGATKIFLISLGDQDVFIEALQLSVHFAHWETIHTEISQKYDLLTMERLLSETGLEIVDLFFDSEQFFCDVLVKKAGE